MKRSFIKLALVLLIGALMISLAGCTLLDQFINAPDNGDSLGQMKTSYDNIKPLF